MARRQEQEPAQEEVSEVAPGVLRMQLPIRMPGLGHVNMYALLDDRGAAVVDPGLPGASTWRAIQSRLKQADLRVRDVHTVVVTHSHPDHFGGAARFAKEAGSEVVAHRAFRFGPAQAAQEPEVSVDDLAAAQATDPRSRDLAEEESGGEELSGHAHSHGHSHRHVEQAWNRTTPWGGEHPKPGFRTRMKWRVARLLGNSFIPTVTHRVERGDRLTLAGREWQITHTPGHTEDHICLHDPEEGVFLAGDHVLPTITPHISGLASAKDPLDAFFDSLDLVAALPNVSCCLPAHGHPFDDLAGRAQAIKAHHDDRLLRVREIGRELGGATVAAFSQKLFKPRSWGGMAESETYAHLEHLRLAGLAESHRDPSGLLVYETG
ncbi:MAG: MBL fold metallo-hydrolase [Myxococcota bacterium]|nr:MBL fold metallo-hydrolase [Myxococcota bacterium]